MKIETLNIGDLNPAPYNPRTITEEALKGLEKSIETFGYIEPIVVNIREGKNVIISGHQRYKALKNMGINQAQCVLVDLDEVKEKALNVAANNQHISGDYDLKGLELILDELHNDLPEFVELNFDDLANEFDFVLDELDDFNPELPSGGKAEIKTATFTFSNEQFNFIDNLIKKEIKENTMLDDPSGINENRNGNALYSICQKIK